MKFVEVTDLLEWLNKPTHLIRDGEYDDHQQKEKAIFWEWDLENNRLYLSPELRQLFGYGQDKPVPIEGFWHKHIHPEDLNKVINHFLDFINGLLSHYEQIFRVRSINGSYIWVQSAATLKRDDKGEVTWAKSYYTDVTTLKEQKGYTKLGSDKYRNLFQNSMIAMVRNDLATGDILEANDKFWDLFSISLDKRNATKCQDIIGEKHAKLIFDLLKNEGSIDNLELEIKDWGPTSLWISFGAILYEEEGVVDCIIKDITETKSSLIELQKVNFELDSFIYHSSHDLRSPLRSILGLIDVFRLEKDEKIKLECISKIKSSVKRLDSLVIDLLSISRNDRVNDPHVSINFMVEINSSITSYYYTRDNEGLEIITNIHQPVEFFSDLTRIRVILNNLISNAIKYRSRHKEYSYVKVDVTVDEEKAIIEIEDNGEGIEASKMPHIFDMFYRATEKSEGSGLGLYIVKKVADKLNAEIKVRSEELEGTNFKFVIPNTK
ncbi:sensor histidine kinase [Fulvivirga sediminis]|uniref:histidine kinase n=1 Tax=Fulvivirga sediminis TaxID=2803949 RepID=A0A937F2B1_9BACT|nr:PAS domain-containing sensor histidine kinase [Fulvivirga sediminis]MBL3654992.1 PAS domain-containing sensor histidine kinase [Fulvivirga sediminis]